MNSSYVKFVTSKFSAVATVDTKNTYRILVGKPENGHLEA